LLTFPTRFSSAPRLLLRNFSNRGSTHGGGSSSCADRLATLDCFRRHSLKPDAVLPVGGRIGRRTHSGIPKPTQVLMFKSADRDYFDGSMKPLINSPPRAGRF
jgi:hypothetical protein